MSKVANGAMPGKKAQACAAGAFSGVGSRQTRQREVILQVLLDARSPLLIREIYARARSINGTIGVATIYRTLNALYESEQIQMVHWPSGQAFYRYDLKDPPDCFECRECKTFFILDACSLCLREGHQTQRGFVVQSCQVLLHGLCPDCAHQDSTET